MQVGASVDTIQGLLERNSHVGVKAQATRGAEQQKPDRVREESRGRDGFEFKKSRLREARQFRKQEHRALFSAKRQLKQIVHAVRDELKEIGRAADGKDVERVDDDGDDDRIDGLNRVLRHLNRDFRQDVKQAFRDARDGRSLDGEQLIADTRAAFERLVNDVKDTLGSTSVEPPAADDGEATGLAPAPVNPFEPAEPADTDAIVEISAPGNAPPNVPAADTGPLTELVARIEELLAKLTELLTPDESEERPTATSLTLEVAVTVYARATFSFDGQLSGSGLDALS